MNKIGCRGFEGSNPLHFLAALGILRILQRTEATPKLQWQIEGGVWFPIFTTKNETINEMAKICSEWLMALGKTNAADRQKDKNVKQIKAEISNLKVEIESKKKILKNDKSNTPLQKQLQSMLALEKEKKALLSLAQSDAITTMGDGVAHLGDVIGVLPEDFRRMAQKHCNLFSEKFNKTQQKLCTDDSIFIVAQLSALATDCILDKDGKIKPTYFSFSNGGSGKCLLKDFRACAELSNEMQAYASFCGTHNAFIDKKGVSALNWNPTDLRNRALMWDDPGDSELKVSVDVATNALAYLGLASMTVVPLTNKIAVIGWCDQKDYRGFNWCIWAKPLTLDTILSLLQSNESTEELKKRGVDTVFFSEVINPNGKRNYFTPARLK